MRKLDDTIKAVSDYSKTIRFGLDGTDPNPKAEDLAYLLLNDLCKLSSKEVQAIRMIVGCMLAKSFNKGNKNGLLR